MIISLGQFLMNKLLTSLECHKVAKGSRPPFATHSPWTHPVSWSCWLQVGLQSSYSRYEVHSSRAIVVTSLVIVPLSSFYCIVVTRRTPSLCLRYSPHQNIADLQIFYRASYCWCLHYCVHPPVFYILQAAC